MVKKHKGNWPYHETRSGNWAPCANNPCRRHSGGDIMATSPEDAYAKAHANDAPAGLSSTVKPKPKTKRMRLPRFRNDPDREGEGAYFRCKDGSVYHVRENGSNGWGIRVNGYVPVDPETGMENPYTQSFSKQLPDKAVAVPPIRPENLTGLLKITQGMDDMDNRILVLTADNGTSMTLYANDGEDVYGTLKDYGFVCDGYTSKGGWICHYQYDDPPEMPSGTLIYGGNYDSENPCTIPTTFEDEGNSIVGTGTDRESTMNAIISGSGIFEQEEKPPKPSDLKKRMAAAYRNPAEFDDAHDFDDPGMIGAEIRLLDEAVPDEPSDDWGFNIGEYKGYPCTVLRKGRASLVYAVTGPAPADEEKQGFIAIHGFKNYILPPAPSLGMLKQEMHYDEA